MGIGPNPQSPNNFLYKNKRTILKEININYFKIEK